MVKLSSFVQFPVNPLFHPVMLSLVFFLLQFATFTYYVINGFTSFSYTYFPVEYYQFSFCYNENLDIIVGYYERRFSFSVFSFSTISRSSGVLSFQGFCLKYPYSDIFFSLLDIVAYLFGLMLPLLFLVAVINHSLHFLVYSTSTNRCIYATLNTRESSFTYFSWYV